MFNEDYTVERMVLDTLCGGTHLEMVAAEKKKIYPQITRINADSIIGLNLRTSAKSADKKGTIHV